MLVSETLVTSKCSSQNRQQDIVRPESPWGQVKDALHLWADDIPLVEQAVWNCVTLYTDSWHGYVHNGHRKQWEPHNLVQSVWGFTSASFGFLASDRNFRQTILAVIHCGVIWETLCACVCDFTPLVERIRRGCLICISVSSNTVKINRCLELSISCQFIRLSAMLYTVVNEFRSSNIMHNVKPNIQTICD